MSKTLQYTKEHNLSKLHDELKSVGVAPERVEGKDMLITLTVPDDADEALVAAVAAAHSPAARVDGQGDALLSNAVLAWDGSKLSLAENKVPANWPGAVARMAALLPDAVALGLAGEFGLLMDTLARRDTATVQAVYNRLNTLQAGGDPPLTGTQWNYFKAVLREKRIPIVW